MLYSVLKNNNIAVHYFDVDAFDFEVFKNIDLYQVSTLICTINNFKNKTMKVYDNLFSGKILD